MKCATLVLMKLPQSLTTVTWFSKCLAVFLFIIFLLGAFRLGMNYQHAVNIAQQQPPTISPQPTDIPTKSLHIVTITMQDNGEVKQAKVGDKVLLQLLDGLDWNIGLSNNTVLMPSPDGILYIRRPQGRYKAIAPGSVVISATGRAKCPKGAMCAQMIVGFTTTVVVSQ